MRNENLFINFENDVQAALFEIEFKGQISDGMWENTPGTDWEMYCDAKVGVDPENLGKNFRARKEGFNFTALIEYVGDRMLAYSKLAHLFGYDIACLFEKIVDWNGKFTGIPTWMLDSDNYNDTIEKIVKAISELGGLEAVKEAYENCDYTEAQMRKEITRVKKIIKMVAYMQDKAEIAWDNYCEEYEDF